MHKNILSQILNTILQEQREYVDSTQLLGHIPALDSFTILTLINAIEDSFDFEMNDDEINAELFETFGSLSQYIAQKLS